MATWPRMIAIPLNLPGANDAAVDVPLNLLETNGYEKAIIQLQTVDTACYISLKPWGQNAIQNTDSVVDASFKILPGEQIIFDSRHPFFGVEYYLNPQGTFTAQDMDRGARLVVWLSGGDDAAKMSRSVVQ